MCVHVLSVYSSLQSCVGREGSALAPLADAAQPSCRKSERKGKKKKREAVVWSRMRIETVSPAALGTAGFRYLYSVCFFKLFGPTGL